MFCTALIDGFIIIPFYVLRYKLYVLRYKPHLSLDIIDVFQLYKKRTFLYAFTIL